MASFTRFPVVPTRSTPVVDGIGRDKCMEDFDQFKTLRITGSATSFVYELNGDDHAMQSCKRRQWSACRAKLINLARANKLFLATHFTFSDEDNVYVGSEIAHMCLSDVIHCVAMTEQHVGAVLLQVSTASRNTYGAEAARSFKHCPSLSARIWHTMGSKRQMSSYPVKEISSSVSDYPVRDV